MLPSAAVGSIGPLSLARLGQLAERGSNFANFTPAGVALALVQVEVYEGEARVSVAGA